jgi:tetratricopeptide (TPR) repeat protein
MKFIKNLVAEWLYFRASSNMRKEKFQNAIPIYLKVLDLEKDIGLANAITLFEIGYCYYKCNNRTEALLFFSKSYNIYKKNKDNLQMKPFYYLLIYYSSLLKEKGENEVANQLFDESLAIKKKLKGRI